VSVEDIRHRCVQFLVTCWLLRASIGIGLRHGASHETMTMLAKADAPVNR
jgi:hypothetical protein